MSLPPDEFPMPTEKGLGPDDERRPPVSGHRSARSRQQDPVETVESRALHLPLQHLHLVPEHEELDLPSFIPTPSGSEDAADEEVHQREQLELRSGRGEGHATDVTEPHSGKLQPSRLRRPRVALDQLPVLPEAHTELPREARDREAGAEAIALDLPRNADNNRMEASVASGKDPFLESVHPLLPLLGRGELLAVLAFSSH
jgi:hypothetical protein